MTARTFVDSNILIYAHDADAGSQAAQGRRPIGGARVGRQSGLLSTQVLQEFFVNVTQKIKVPLSRGTAREVIRDYAPWAQCPITPATVARASEISEVWKISFWDGMILAAAEESRADHLLTEDLNHGSRIAGVLIVDPFRATASE